MGVTDRIRTAWGALTRPEPELRSIGWPADGLTLANGMQYPFGITQTMPGGRTEELTSDFTTLVQGAYQANGIVFACMVARLQLFSEARFQFRAMTNGRPGDLFGTSGLDLLEHPWPGATTGDLLARMLVHADLAGNAFLVRRPGRIKLLRPDWVSIMVGSEYNADVTAIDIDADVLGYVYYPGGRHSGHDPVPLQRSEVAHFAPVPDPLANYRGMSWLTPVVREIMGDSAATSHKLRFWENGATPNLVVKRNDVVSGTAFAEWVALMEAGHSGAANAYKTLYLTAGADATVVGKDLQQMDFKVVQGAGETRIAAAAGMHPVIVGLSEGLAGSSLNAGNFNSARRLVADRTLRPLWRNAAGSLETIVRPPTGSSLWYDDRDIAFLREDRKDAAEIQQIQATSMAQLTNAGWTAESVVAATEAEDWGLLRHSGLFSVQLQPPGTTAPVTPVTAPTNGAKPGVAA